MKPSATSVPPNDARIDVDVVEAEPLESLVTWATSRMLLSARMHLTHTPQAVQPTRRPTTLPAVVPLAG